MEANELRINNLIYHHSGRIEKVTPHLIKSLYEGYYPKHLLPKPIPLTEDILLRLGFEKKNGIYNLEISSSLKIEISEVQGVYYVYLFQYAVHQYDNDQSILLRKDCYVHTLQNVIHSLTGKELELKD